MDAEKFNITWSEYQTIFTRSFSKLRHDTDLSDVTLVSDDQEPIPAHRLILSASSEFFKGVFYNNKHNNIVLYMSDIKSKEVNLILDYIYFGEVNILQDSLERFILIAQKLKLEGLGEAATQREAEDEDPGNSVTSQLLMPEQDEDTKDSEDLNITTKYYKHLPTFESSVDLETLDQNIKDLTENQGERCSCKVCGKSISGRNRRQNMADHVETHIEGLSFKCLQCGKLYRTRNLLRSHQLKYCNKHYLHRIAKVSSAKIL